MKILRIPIIITIIAFSTLFIACNQREILSTQTIKNYQLDENNLKSIQFYLRGTIVLYKSNTKGSTHNDENGALVINEEKQGDRIIIKDGTAGVVVKRIDDKRIAVSFEAGDKRLLVFGDVDKSGKYMLLAEKWEGNYGKLRYGDQYYYIQPNYGNQPYLEFDIKKNQEIKMSTSVVGGRKL